MWHRKLSIKKRASLIFIWNLLNSCYLIIFSGYFPSYRHLYTSIELNCRSSCQRVRTPLIHFFFNFTKRGRLRPNKTSLTPPLFIEVPVPSQECERSCIFLLVASILPLSTNFLGGFWKYSDSVVFFVFILVQSYVSRRKG